MDTVMDILVILKYIGMGLIAFFAFGIACAIVSDILRLFIRYGCIHNNCTILYTISSNNLYN